MNNPKAPHLTPAKLVGRRFAPDVFGPVKVALIGYCPPPPALENYHPRRFEEQHFIHVSPDSVRMLRNDGREYLSLAHVYGGPVSSSTVEELAYYGIELILAYGLAGGLGTKGLKMGAFYLVEDALAADGTTRHYSQDRIVSANRQLVSQTQARWIKSDASPPIVTVRAATGDAIYREDDKLLDSFRREGCDIVNLDSAHLYAASSENAAGRQIRTVQCGVISDIVTGGPSPVSESTLSAMLANGDQGLNPLTMTGKIVSFYIESLLPSLGY